MDLFPWEVFSWNFPRYQKKPRALPLQALRKASCISRVILFIKITIHKECIYTWNTNDPCPWLENAFFWTAQPSKQRTNRFQVYTYIRYIYIYTYHSLKTLMSLHMHGIGGESVGIHSHEAFLPVWPASMAPEINGGHLTEVITFVTLLTLPEANIALENRPPQ